MADVHVPPAETTAYAGARTVGILGGMGPLATVETFRRIVVGTPATRDQDHLHVIVDSDPAVPDRTAALLYGGPDPRPHLLAGARRLFAAGAEVVCMPCNTAHAYHSWLQRRLPVPLVHMLREAASLATATGDTRFGLLATTGTAETGLYQAEFAQFGLDILRPDPEVQRLVMAAIDAVKAGADRGSVLAYMNTAACALEAGGAQHLIAGCTEISLVSAQIDSPLPLIDALDALVAATLRLAVPLPQELVPHVL